MPFYKDVPLGTRQLESEPSAVNSLNHPLLHDPTQRFIQELVDKIARQIQLLLRCTGLKVLAGYGYRVAVPRFLV